jgi:hypothetical protein
MEEFISEEFRSMIYAMYGLIFIFYASLLYWVRKRKIKRRGQKYFFKGVISILQACMEDEECVPQINLLYKRLSKHYSTITDAYRSSVELLEELIVHLDTLEEKVFKERFSIPAPEDQRQRIVNVYRIMKTKNPYSSLSSKEANLLMVMSSAIENKNEELGKNTVLQVADEFEILESSLRKQSKNNTVSFLIAIVSVILTVFFGVATFALIR